MTSAREEILDRIRRAVSTPSGSDRSSSPPASASTDGERAYRTTAAYPPGAPELVDLFAGRVEDYRATVTRCPDDPHSIATAVQAALYGRAVSSVVVPDGLPDWVPADGRVVDHSGLTPTELDAVGAVVTGCAVAIAETGTIVLDGGPECGRRVVTLVPDLHICVVRAGQLVGSVPEGVARLDPNRALTFISGPSATSDIELDRVEGVHGPRTLHVVLAG